MFRAATSPDRPLYSRPTTLSAYAATVGQVDLVDARVDAELRAAPGRVGDLGRMQDRLGRNAAAVQAGAAHLVLLDQADAQPELGGPEGAGVTPAARPEYQ